MRKGKRGTKIGVVIVYLVQSNLEIQCTFQKAVNLPLTMNSVVKKETSAYRKFRRPERISLYYVLKMLVVRVIFSPY